MFVKDKYHPAANSVTGTTTVASKKNKTKKKKKKMTENVLFDEDSSNDDDEYTYDDNDDNTHYEQNTKVVNSHSNQRYGAVACQIHARGVHTSLLMDVAVSEDGLYAFGGVQRGSVELAAVYLGDVEAYLDEQLRQQRQLSTLQPMVGLLDLIQVDRHADAKLKGFGACTRLWNGWDRAQDANERPEYLLCTGKGIKNIHIWSYKPSRLARDEDAIWSCLYDTQTNGTSINQLYFRHNDIGTLQAISKSDDQKLRVWDLTYEQNRIARNSGTANDRPKRPDYVDVASTEGTVGVIGPYAFASGSLGGMHNIINVVGLDVDDLSSPFNSSELLLPLSDPLPAAITTTSRTGRQQRGDLKSVEHVAGLVFDASHALLQLSDGSVVHYLHDVSGHPSLLPCPPSLCTTSIDDDGTSSYGIVSPATGLHNKRISLARVGSQAMVLFAVSSFNENTSRGAIMLRALPGSSGIINNGSGSKSFRRYWGFNGLKKKRKQQQIMAVVHSPLGTPIGGLGTIDSTPVNMVGKVMNSMRHVTPVDTSPFQSHHSNDRIEKSKSRFKASPSQEGQNDTTPVHLPKGDSKHKKISPDADDSLVALEAEVVEHIRSNSKSRHDNDRMDSQLEVIGQGTSVSPMPVQKHTMTKSSKLLSDGTPKKKKQKTDGGNDTIHQDPKQTPTRSSPKRRARFKSPESSFDNDLPHFDVTKEGSNSTVVGFTGMTVFDRKKDVQLPESCFQPKQRPMLLVEQLPMSTLASRLALRRHTHTPIDLTVDDVTTSVTEGGVHFQRHCNERRQLTAKHRAEHELIRKKVLHSIRYVLSTWDIELMSNNPHAVIVESARTWFNDALECHQEMLDDMLGRQVMEAEALAAQQTSDLATGHAPVVQVSFPFPEVFEQARQEMIALIQ